MSDVDVVLAGGTGALGKRIASQVIKRGGTVRALVRPDSPPRRVEALRTRGVEIQTVEFDNRQALTRACEGAACVVSALSGVRDVIVDAQTALLDAAVAAEVPRFIPSDFAIDFTRAYLRGNRNLDLRREFKARLDEAPIAATSILNGMFTELLTGQAPVILFPFKRVVYWEDADQPLDFTTKDDTAAYTAAAALDPSTPRVLRIAGDVLSARQMATVVSDLTGETFKLFKAGNLDRLEFLAKTFRTLFPQRKEAFPPWQGMVYLRDMFSGQLKLDSLDNGRYPDLKWSTVRDVLSAHLA